MRIKTLAWLLTVVSLCSTAAAQPSARQPVTLLLDSSFTLAKASTELAAPTFYALPRQATAQGIICEQYATNTAGSLPTLAGKIQDCATQSAATCYDLCTFDACTTGACNTSGKEGQWPVINRTILPYIRYVPTMGGTSTVYNLNVRLWR